MNSSQLWCIKLNKKSSCGSRVIYRFLFARNWLFAYIIHSYQITRLRYNFNVGWREGARLPQARPQVKQVREKEQKVCFDTSLVLRSHVVSSMNVLLLLLSSNLLMMFVTILSNASGQPAAWRLKIKQKAAVAAADFYQWENWRNCFVDFLSFGAYK